MIHTLGDWELRNGTILVCNENGPRKHIAYLAWDVDEMTPDGATGLGDGLLLASAPNLLAACEEDGADHVDDKPNGPALLRMAASILNSVGYPTVAARLSHKARAEEVAILKARGEA